MSSLGRRLLDAVSGLCLHSLHFSLSPPTHRPFHLCINAVSSMSCGSFRLVSLTLPPAPSPPHPLSRFLVGPPNDSVIQPTHTSHHVTEVTPPLSHILITHCGVTDSKRNIQPVPLCLSWFFVQTQTKHTHSETTSSITHPYTIYTRTQTLALRKTRSHGAISHDRFVFVIDRCPWLRQFPTHMMRRQQATFTIFDLRIR